MNVRRKKIRTIVDNLLSENCVESPEVPVDLIAKRLGLKVEYGPFQKDLSGCIIRHGSSAMVCINVNHSKTRQRFTLAHEIGHFLLHSGEEGFVDNKLNLSELSLPKGMISNRNVEGAGSPEEKEANYFAAELLMPKIFMDKDIQHALTSTDDESILATMAKRYNVSEDAMSFRLNNLGYISK